MKAVKDTIKRMNEYGRNKTPFVFIIDFDLQKPIKQISDNNHTHTYKTKEY